jgi:hypothetical protein
LSDRTTNATPRRIVRLAKIRASERAGSVELPGRPKPTGFRSAGSTSTRRSGRTIAVEVVLGVWLSA